MPRRQDVRLAHRAELRIFPLPLSLRGCGVEVDAARRARSDAEAVEWQIAGRERRLSELGVGPAGPAGAADASGADGA